MLPPHELKNKTFSRSMRGYNTVEVDEYIEFIIEKYTELYRENDELERKLKTTVTKLEEIKGDEDSIRSTLIDAKRAASMIKSEAEDRAEAVIRSAKASCNTILSDFNEKIEDGRNTLVEVKRSTLELKRELFDRYSEHIRYLDRLTEGIDMSDIPDTNTLRRKAVDTLKSNIAQIYATPASANDLKNKPSTPQDAKTEPETAQTEVPEQSKSDISDTVVFNPSEVNSAASVQDENTASAADTDSADDNTSVPDKTSSGEPMQRAFGMSEHYDAASGGSTADEPEIEFPDENSTRVFTKVADDIPAQSDSIPADNAAGSSENLIVDREPLKPAKGGIRDSIKELNKRYKETNDIVNTPDSDIADDANYLDFVKSVTGKDKPENDSAKDADFDLLFNDSKKKK